MILMARSTGRKFPATSASARATLSIPFPPPISNPTGPLKLSNHPATGSRNVDITTAGVTTFLLFLVSPHTPESGGLLSPINCHRTYRRAKYCARQIFRVVAYHLLRQSLAEGVRVRHRAQVPAIQTISRIFHTIGRKVRLCSETLTWRKKFARLLRPRIPPFEWHFSSR